MTCGRTRRVLWPDGGPRVTSPEVIDAQEHAARCAACQRFMRDMRELGEAVRATAPREQAPAEVRGRLFSAIARTRVSARSAPRLHSRGRWLAAAAVLAVALTGAIMADRLLRDTTVDPIAMITEEHARAVDATRIGSTDPIEVARWLAGEVHFAMQVPVLPGAQLRGARLHVIGDRRGAVVEYDVNGVAVSYFVVPDATEPADRADSVRFDRATRAGYRVVSWREPGLLHAMVGNLPESQLATLAKACVEQARRAVVWLDGPVRPIENQEG